MNGIRLAATYSAVAALAAAAFLASNGETAAPAALSGFALLAVAGRFGMDAELRELVASAAPSLPRREKVAGPIVAALLVTAALGAPLGSMSPVQPAAATHECTTTEKLVTFSFGLTGYATDKFLFDGKCTESHTSQVVNDVLEAEANQTELEIYEAALQQRDDTDADFATYNNYLNDTESAAWMQAEMAIAEAYQNGSSKSVAASKAKSAIADYYAVKQYNLLQRGNTKIAAYYYMSKRALNETGVRPDLMRAYHSNSDSWGTPHWAEGVGAYGGNGWRNRTVTLVNGSTATELRVSHSDQYGKIGSFYGASQIRDGEILVQSPDSNHEQIVFHDADRWEAMNNRIVNQNNDLQAEVDVFVNSTWEAMQNGEIGPEDVLSRNTQMFRYGNDALGENSSTYNVMAALSSMGLDSPQLNGTGTMSVTYRGTTYHGLILARNAPNGSWQAGTTYDPANITGPVLLAHTGGSTIELTDQFTVEGITAEDGSEIQQVNTTKVVYKTHNSTELIEKMNEIAKLQAEIEERQLAAAGGGTTSSSGEGTGLLEKLAALLGVSVGAAAAVLAAAGLLVLKIYAPSR